jgi:hypothetical protein
MHDPALSDTAGDAPSAGEVTLSGTPKCGTNTFEVKQFPTVAPDRIPL